MPETSTDVLAMTVKNNCATGNNINAETTVTPLQYNSYDRAAGSTNDAYCRPETTVKFTVTNTGLLGVTARTNGTRSGGDGIGGLGQRHQHL